MAFKVYLSQVKDVNAFKADVTGFIDQMHKFAYTKGVPRPTAHSLVEACVERRVRKNAADTYVANYEIVDDTKKESDIPLPQRKELCLHRLRMAEFNAREKVLPQLKIRLMNLIWGESLAKAECDRLGSDLDNIVDHERVKAAFDKINKLGAVTEAGIHDLTEETVDSWHPPSFD
jgi:hypothetical protein